MPTWRINGTLSCFGDGSSQRGVSASFSLGTGDQIVLSCWNVPGILRDKTEVNRGKGRALDK